MWLTCIFSFPVLADNFVTLVAGAGPRQRLKLADDLFGVSKSNSLGSPCHIGFDIFVRSNDPWLVHGIERDFHVRQKVLNVLDHAKPDLRPEEIRGGGSIAVQHLDFHFKISGLAPHESCFDAPKWFNVMVDLIEKLFYNGCIVGLGELEPFVKPGGGWRPRRLRYA